MLNTFNNSIVLYKSLVSDVYLFASATLSYFTSRGIDLQGRYLRPKVTNFLVLNYRIIYLNGTFLTL